MAQEEVISTRTNLLRVQRREGPEERRFSCVWFQLKERSQSGFMAMVKGGWGSSLCSPHAGLVTLGHPGGSGLTAVAEEQQSDVLLPRQDSGNSSFRECIANYPVWGFVA